jgi:tRNA(Leu) C34 or U34 (ribose-2'-O)-methylase TrmL
MYDKIVNDKMKPQDIFKIENAELRRIAYEYMDKAKMKKLKDYKVLDKSKDQYNNKMAIIEFKVD